MRGFLVGRDGEDRGVLSAWATVGATRQGNRAALAQRRRRYGLGRVPGGARRSFVGGQVASAGAACFSTAASARRRNKVQTQVPTVWWTTLANLPFRPRRKPRLRMSSTALPPSRGAARSSQVLPASKTLESITVAFTDPGWDQSYRHRSQKRPMTQVPSVTSAKFSPLSCTSRWFVLTFDHTSARRGEKSRPASSTRSGDADDSAATVIVSTRLILLRGRAALHDPRCGCAHRRGDHRRVRGHATRFAVGRRPSASQRRRPFIYGRKSAASWVRLEPGLGRRGLVMPARRIARACQDSPPAVRVNALRDQVSAGRALAAPSPERRCSCTKRTTVPPSPTAAATRFIEPCRTSPAANTPGTLVSSVKGSRS